MRLRDEHGLSTRDAQESIAGFVTFHVVAARGPALRARRSLSIGCPERRLVVSALNPRRRGENNGILPFRRELFLNALHAFGGVWSDSVTLGATAHYLGGCYRVLLGEEGRLRSAGSAPATAADCSAAVAVLGGRGAPG